MFQYEEFYTYLLNFNKFDTKRKFLMNCYNYKIAYNSFFDFDKLRLKCLNSYFAGIIFNFEVQTVIKN